MLGNGMVWIVTYAMLHPESAAYRLAGVLLIGGAVTAWGAQRRRKARVHV